MAISYIRAYCPVCNHTDILTQEKGVLNNNNNDDDDDDDDNDDDKLIPGVDHCLGCGSKISERMHCLKQDIRKRFAPLCTPQQRQSMLLLRILVPQLLQPLLLHILAIIIITIKIKIIIIQTSTTNTPVSDRRCLKETIKN